MTAPVPTRKTIRLGIASFFGGSTFDAVNRIYRPTPLAANGLAGVRPYFGTRMPDTDYTFGFTPGRDMGAVAMVHLNTTGPDTEARRAFAGPTSGIKQRVYGVGLHVYHLSSVPHADDAQDDLDQLLEAMELLIHGDRSLGATVVEAGETKRGIQVQQGEPYITKGPPFRTELYAVMTFDAVVYYYA